MSSRWLTLIKRISVNAISHIDFMKVRLYIKTFIIQAAHNLLQILAYYRRGRNVAWIASP